VLRRLSRIKRHLKLIYRLSCCSSITSTPAFSTPAGPCRCFHSRIFHHCKIVPEHRNAPVSSIIITLACLSGYLCTGIAFVLYCICHCIVFEVRGYGTLGTMTFRIWIQKIITKGCDNIFAKMWQHFRWFHSCSLKVALKFDQSTGISFEKNCIFIPASHWLTHILITIPANTSRNSYSAGIPNGMMALMGSPVFFLPLICPEYLIKH